MKSDPTSLAGAVARIVDNVERDGRPARLIIASRTYNTSVEDLWDALTNIERIPRWFLPITGDLVVGGRYDLVGNASGEILRCEPPTSFEVTWEYGGDTSWVTVTIGAEPDGSGALLELRHLAHVPEESWDEYGPGAVGVGWDLALLGLHLHIESGETVDPAEVAAWQASTEGREFVPLVSESWCAASIAAGTEPSAARAAAQRTTEAYTASDIEP